MRMYKVYGGDDIEFVVGAGSVMGALNTVLSYFTEGDVVYVSTTKSPLTHMFMIRDGHAEDFDE